MVIEPMLAPVPPEQWRRNGLYRIVSGHPPSRRGDLAARHELA
jgi:hypothetical protein